MWGLCTDLPASQVSRTWIQAAAVLPQSLAGVGGSCGLFDLAGLGTAVALLPACLGAAHTRKGECSVRAFMSCLNLMLRFNSQDEACHSSACTKEV